MAGTVASGCCDLTSSPRPEVGENAAPPPLVEGVCATLSAIDSDSVTESDPAALPPATGQEAGGATRPLLWGPRQALHAALQSMGGGVADLYLGALWALDRSENPDRYAQAAHSLRELMNAVPVSVGVEVRALDERFGDRFSSVHQAWDSMFARTNAYDGGWKGEIDPPLARFLAKAMEFFSWAANHRPRRKAEFADALGRLDSSGRTLPPRLEDLNVQTWIEIREYFIAVCHHNKVADGPEFESWMNAFELFLLDRLQPRTFEDFNEIDSIIAAGEAS
jgi:hypothetical protein